MKYPIELFRLLAKHSEATEKSPISFGNVSFWLHSKELCWDIPTAKWNLEKVTEGMALYIEENIKNIIVVKDGVKKTIPTFELFIHHKRQGWESESQTLNQMADFFNANRKK